MLSLLRFYKAVQFVDGMLTIQKIFQLVLTKLINKLFN